jgi:hypothetical protein
LTKQSWKWRRRREAAMRGSSATAFSTAARTISSARGQSDRYASPPRDTPTPALALAPPYPMLTEAPALPVTQDLLTGAASAAAASAASKKQDRATVASSMAGTGAQCSLQMLHLGVCSV